MWHTCIYVGQEVVVTLGRSRERVLRGKIKTNMSASELAAVELCDTLLCNKLQDFRLKPSVSVFTRK